MFCERSLPYSMTEAIPALLERFTFQNWQVLKEKGGENRFMIYIADMWERVLKYTV